MEINGQKFWSAHRPSDWVLPPELAFEQGALRLSSLRTPTVWPGTRATAETIVNICPATLDDHQHIAFVVEDSGAWLVKVRRTGESPTTARTIHKSATAISALAAGASGILYVATQDGVTLLDMHPPAEQVFAPFTASLINFPPFRFAADPTGGCWVLTTTGAVLRLDGRPLPTLATLRFTPEPIRPQEENTNPPRLTLAFPAPPAASRVVALAWHPSSGLALLCWTANADAFLYFPATATSMPLPGLAHPTSVSWLDDSRLALLYPSAKEAAVFELNRGFVGDYYPLHPDPNDLPFCHTLRPGAFYQSALRILSVERLSLPTLASSGIAPLAQPFDSGIPRTTWHRLYLEACIPPGCSITIHAAASDSPDATQVTTWHPHHFGAPTAPSACWLSETSEIPFHAGFLTTPPVADRSGLFMILLQSTGRAVSTLNGRYLHLRLELHGTTQSSPHLAALRAYAFRYNYAERHLPELYRETNFGADADALSPSPAPTDFLARYLSLFESFLTPLEDQIANAHLLTRPDTVPDASLDWLAQWVGVTFDPAFPPARRREWLAASSDLQRTRGTLPGFSLALDIASGGGVRGGEIVIVENYRLRRVLATILGVDFTNYDDPLLPGLEQSGNSIVGDSLILSEESRSELLALFDASLLRGLREESAAVSRLADQLAHRVTVLIHQDLEPVDIGLVRRVAEREKPAYVSLTFAEASLPFLAGITSLIGVDTYLATRPTPGPVRLNKSSLGVWDKLTQRPALDPNFPG